jgi:SAM-dependent methyltransferase
MNQYSTSLAAEVDAVSTSSQRYDPLERLHVRRPVDRVAFISERCRGKRVLDIGCFDETALVKRDTKHYLHGRISAVARQVIGIDSSPQLPREGVQTGSNSRIVRGNGVRPDVPDDIDVIVAGEFIEHIESPMEFFRNLKRRYPGKQMIISTPNGTSFANVLLALFGREAQHPDHLQIFTFKILRTLCTRMQFREWEIIPYRFQASEMILGSRGPKRAAAVAVQGFVGVVERIFPLLSCGYIVRATL